MDEGPKVKIRKIEFVGNKAISDGTLKRQMKENKERGRSRTSSTSRPGSSPDRRHGTYQETKFDEDAEKVVDYYRDHGYIRAQRRRARAEGARATPRTRRRAGSSCGFRSPKGTRYKVGNFDVAGNTVVKTRVPEAAVQAERRASTTARSGSARASRRRRKSTAPAATSSSPAIPDYKFRDDPNPNRARGARRRSRRPSRPQAERRRRSST